MSMNAHEGHRRHWTPNHTIIHYFAGSLYAAPQKCIGRTSYQQAFLLRQLQYWRTFCAVQCQWLFNISVFAGVQNVQIYCGMSLRHGEIDNDFNGGVTQ